MASRPSTMPSASTTCQVRVMSSALGENVRTQGSSSRVPGRDGRRRHRGSGAGRGPDRRRRRAAPARSRRTTLGARTRPGQAARAAAAPGRPGPSRRRSRRQQAQPWGGAMTPPTRDRSPLREQPGDVRRPPPAPAHLDQGAHHRADHLVAERRWPRCRTAAAGRPSPSSPGRTGTSRQAGVEHPPEDGVAGGGPRRPPAEGPEVVLPEQGVGAARPWPGGRGGPARARPAGRGAGRGRRPRG